MANAITQDAFRAAPKAPFYEVSSDLEFSDFGRDSRVPPGLWILLSPFLSVAMVWMIIRLF
ncbi:MAG TPA: hypothetical protein VGG10_08280 [Rhizomicrobium sp.]|jgi:hypothetical protein